MNRTDLASRVAADASLSKADAASAINAVFSAVAIAEFGTSSTRERPALRDAVNR